MSPRTPPLQRQLTDLYVTNQGWLRGWLQRRLGCRQQAADLVQDTFVRLLQREELLLAREPRAYLLTIAKRVLIDHWRHERIEQAYLEALRQLPEECQPSPEERYLLLELLEDIDRRLDGLPLIVKRVFLHAQLEGLKQAEIAERLGISLSTVKRYLVQAASQCYFALGPQA